MTAPQPRFNNRELSWLQFNRRVLDEARDPRNPLLERVKFFNIFTSNLDEFFMKRVGGLKRQVLAKVGSTQAEELSPSEQLRAIRQCVLSLIEEQSECFSKLLRPSLAQEGIELVSYEELTDEER